MAESVVRPRFWDSDDRTCGWDAAARQVTASCEDGDTIPRYDERGPSPVNAEGLHTPDAGGFPPILTTAMAADLLHVQVEYLRRMVRENRIPAHRFPGGREIRFHRDELIEWVRAQPSEDRSPSAGTSAEA